MIDEKKELTKQLIRDIIYLIIVLGLSGLAFYLSVGKNIDQVWHLLLKANGWFILVIVGIVISCFLLRSTAIFSLTRIVKSDYNFSRSLAVDQVGALYRMITPAGLGSHFMEAYVYHKHGVKLADALTVLAMYSIIYQIVLILYGLITIIVKHQLINQIGYINFNFGSSTLTVSLWVLVAIGFAFSVLVIGFILLISYWNGLLNFVKGPVYKGLNKVKIVKDLDAGRAKLDEVVHQFRNNLKLIFSHIPTFLICVLVFFVYITITYSVPYFAGLSLGNTGTYANFWDSVLLGNLHQMITSIIPTPGNSFFSEIFFLKLFYPSSGPTFYMDENVAKGSLLLWRSLMFIIPLFITTIFSLIYFPILFRRKTNDNHEN